VRVNEKKERKKKKNRYCVSKLGRGERERDF
jgi:hypothetical protein